MNEGAPVLTVSELRIPFRMAFSHGSATRAETQAIWCTVKGHGRFGIGEGCPREYVTGENPDSARRFIETHCKDALARIQDVESLRAWTDEHEHAIDANPAAWCALELAILDWLSRVAGVSVETLLGLDAITGQFAYTAVMGDMTKNSYRQTAQLYHAQGFTDFKVKLSGDLGVDADKLHALLDLGIDTLRVRVDANNLWSNAATAARHLRTLDAICPLAGIEEPIGAGDFAAMRALAEDVGRPLILDESCLRRTHVDEAARTPDAFIVNVRISKMGGLLRSLAAVERARVAGLAIIVGAQVGETSVLSRAALPAARAAGRALFAQEGAFGTHLLRYDVTDPALVFGAGGILDTDACDFSRRAGWALDPSSRIASATRMFD